MVAINLHFFKRMFLVAAIFCSVTLQAQEPTPTPTGTPNTAADENHNHQVFPNSGQDIMNLGTEVTSAEELDAIRLEIIELRRFLLILGGMFMAFHSMRLLFKYH